MKNNANLYRTNGDKFIPYMYNDIKSIQNTSAANRFTNFKLHYMKTLLKISLAFILFISYNNLFASGWQQKLL